MQGGGDEMIQLMQDNDIISENMAPFPIYTAMLCYMWKDFSSERRQAMQKLQTVSQLFHEMKIRRKKHAHVQRFVLKNSTQSMDNYRMNYIQDYSAVFLLCDISLYLLLFIRLEVKQLVRL